MNKMKDFDNILDECLQRLLQGDSVEACLSRYPEHAAELEPLLRTARNTMKATDIRPRPEFRDRARYQFQMAIREMPVKESRGFFTVFKPALVTVIMLAIVLLAGGGVVAAAGNSLPGSPLYSVKLATESVRLALTPSALGKAELNAQFANERIDEIIKLAEKGDASLIAETTDRMNRQLMAVANLAVTAEEAAENTFFASQAPVATTAVPTTAPTATPAPVPPPSPTIKATTPIVIPVPTITVPPPDEGILGAASDHTGGAQNEGDEQEQLRDTLSLQYYQNIQALLDELAKAPESLKPALRHAIEVAQAAYETALASLSY
jgi:hypothetical protein